MAVSGSKTLLVFITFNSGAAMPVNYCFAPPVEVLVLLHHTSIG